MPRKRPKLRPDVNETAFRTLQAALGERQRPEGSPNPEAVTRGRKGGKKGGPVRAQRLSAKRRTEIAQKAALARWEKRKSD
jgi:hypothetical protein